ncbi:MAG: hypothetical protein II109_06680, partial [Paludibacteraceae bacterium]|nr:hypothetical protein [Paludibacteraceae bacterium]
MAEATNPYMKYRQTKRNGERFEHDIERRHSALVVIRSVVAVRRALDGDLRELFEFAVVEEAVF